MGSKYQNVAKKSITAKKTSTQRPKYYDEKIQTKPNSSFPAVFIIIIVVLGFSIFGVGKLIESMSQPIVGDTNNNAFYQTNTNIITDDTASSSYLTPLSITDIDGNIYNLADYEGKVVVLYFHFLGCTYCHYHSPNLAEAMGSFTDDQLLVLAITIDPADSSTELESWKSDGGYMWPLIRDVDSSLAYRFEAVSTPRMIYLDPSGADTTAVGVLDTAQIVNTISSLLA